MATVTTRDYLGWEVVILCTSELRVELAFLCVPALTGNSRGQRQRRVDGLLSLL